MIIGDMNHYFFEGKEYMTGINNVGWFIVSDKQFLGKVKNKQIINKLNRIRKSGML